MSCLSVRGSRNCGIFLWDNDDIAVFMIVPFISNVRELDCGLCIWLLFGVFHCFWGKKWWCGTITLSHCQSENTRRGGDNVLCSDHSRFCRNVNSSRVSSISGIFMCGNCVSGVVSGDLYGTGRCGYEWEARNIYKVLTCGVILISRCVFFGMGVVGCVSYGWSILERFRCIHDSGVNTGELCRLINWARW